MASEFYVTPFINQLPFLQLYGVREDTPLSQTHKKPTAAQSPKWSQGGKKEEVSVMFLTLRVGGAGSFSNPIFGRVTCQAPKERGKERISKPGGGPSDLPSEGAV